MIFKMLRPLLIALVVAAIVAFVLTNDFLPLPNHRDGHHPPIIACVVHWRMAKKITLASLAAQMQKGFASLETRMQKGFASVEKRFGSVETRMDKGFAAVAEDIADIKRDMATKDQIIALHTQVNSIETELRGMKHAKLETRVTNLEEKVFGAPRR